MRNVAQVAACGLAGLMAGCATEPAFKGPRPGETWYVSTQRAVVRQSADEWSPAVRSLAYGDAVDVVRDIRVAPPFKGDRARFPEDLIPGWVELRGGGYLAVPGLASEWLLANQDPNEMISAECMTAAKRGFSESESDAELASMRGAAGAGRAASKADPQAVARVLAAYRPLSDADRADFLSKGRLERAPVPAEALNVSGKGALSAAFDGTRQLSAAGLGKAADIASQQGGAGSSLASATGKAVAGAVYSEIGPVQEFQIGRAVAARILPLYPVLPKSDPRSAYVNVCGHALVAASNDPMPYGGYQFILLDSKEVNAFAVPGGFVFVTTGMLEFLKDEDELAAILGHEMGHMELRHGMSAVGREKILKLFSSLKELGASPADGAHGVLREQVGQLVDEVFEKLFTSIRNGYGVEIESQADWRSLQLSAALGYDTRALYDVLERFKSVKGTYGGAGYPAERGADVLVYRSQLGYGNAPAAGRDVRAARYQAVVGRK